MTQPRMESMRLVGKDETFHQSKLNGAFKH